MDKHWICFDAVTKEVVSKTTGVGHKLGYSDENDENIIPTCILATEEEYIKAHSSHVRVDVDAPIRVVSWTEQEVIDHKDAKKASKRQNKKDKINSLDITASDLAKALIELGIVDETLLKDKIIETNVPPEPEPEPEEPVE